MHDRKPICIEQILKMHAVHELARRLPVERRHPKKKLSCNFVVFLAHSHCYINDINRLINTI